MLSFKEIHELWKRDNSLAQALKVANDMLEKTHGMYRDSTKLLRSGEAAETNRSIYAEDRIINQRQIEVRRKILHYLAITGTVNLLPGLVLISIIISVERIGDYTKNITELAMAQPGKLTCGIYETQVCDLEKTVERLFREVRPILMSSTRQAARELWDDCSLFRRSADEIIAELVKGTDESLSRGQTATIALYVRYLKRIGAHLLNILSSVLNPFERIGYQEVYGSRSP